MKNAFLCLISLVVITSCSKEDKKALSIDSLNTESRSSISSWKPLKPGQKRGSIQVVDQFNQPIANAKVLVGSAKDVPFKNNLFVTDQKGQIQNLNNWTTSEHITAEAQGYIRQTLLSQIPGQVTLKLSPAYLPTKAVVTGQVTQLPIVNKDKHIDFGLVMSALTRADLLNFDLNTVISPVSDIMTVASYSIRIPTNVSLPKQKENYVIGLTIEKPEYRYFSSTLGSRKLFAAAGRFPFKEVVDQLRAGKPFYEVINYIDLSGGGLRDLNINNPTTTLDIPGNELAFTSLVSLASPSLDPDEVFVAIAASEVSGFFIPTGIKKMGANETVTLKTIDQKPVFTVSVIKKQSEFMAHSPGADRLSVAFLPYKANTKPNMLPLVNDPSVTNSNGYKISLPTVSRFSGVYQLAVTAAISDLEISGPADKPVTELIRKWEILGTKWPTQIELPNWPLATNKKKRFEINMVGGLKNQTVDLGDELIRAATHVTHSSTDF